MQNTFLILAGIFSSKKFYMVLIQIRHLFSPTSFEIARAFIVCIWNTLQNDYALKAWSPRQEVSKGRCLWVVTGSTFTNGLINWWIQNVKKPLESGETVDDGECWEESGHHVHVFGGDVFSWFLPVPCSVSWPPWGKKPSLAMSFCHHISVPLKIRS